MNCKCNCSADPLLNRVKAAEYLDISPGTLAVWDSTKKYNLEPIKVGSNVRYRRSSLDRFIAQRLKGK